MRFALALVLASAGNSSATRMTMIAITTSSSSKVKAAVRVRWKNLLTCSRDQQSVRFNAGMGELVRQSSAGRLLNTAVNQHHVP